ncbi:MAG TPA: 3-oxoacyl-ACP reductase family protein [Ruminiclostridium sp.]
MDSKVALVTGSSRGIGRGIAISLAKAGYDIAINYNSDKEGAEKVAQEVAKFNSKVVIYKANIQNIDEIKNMFQNLHNDFGRIDLLVNNAGITRMKPVLEVTEEMWNEVMNTDLRGTFFCSQAAFKIMKEKGIKGAIINITSNHALGCWPNSSVYAAAKAGEEKLTKNLALDLSEYGIRVCAIAPGYTELHPENKTFHEKYIIPISKKIPLQRYATPEEIGEAVVFLASEAARYITGVSLIIDGGATLPMVADNRFV